MHHQPPPDLRGSEQRSGELRERAFWAKTGADGDYLPVEAHLLDAGEVGLRLFDLSLTEKQRTWIASGLGVDTYRARALVAFLVAAHDIGKVGPFQHLVAELAGRLGTARLPGFLGKSKRHDQVSGYVLHRYVTEHGGSSLADALIAAVCGHHSVPHAIPVSERRAQLCLLAQWAVYQDALLDHVADAYGLSSFEAFAPPSHAIVLALAGLVNVSDWIASDATRFPTTAGSRPPARELADKAIYVDAWRPRPVTPAMSFVQTFERQPWAMQAAIVERLKRTEFPALVLVEDRTGAGKTEAALWTVRRALEQGARGFYIGLPTRATANQIHRRTCEFLNTLWPGEDHGLRLLHGGAHLRDPGDPQLGATVPDVDDTALDIARAWFDGARRGLLSPYAVGTVDQALLAVLAARFYPVRLWGLTGKVVVIDEAHAYDTYTSTLLENLLRWLAALECTAVVLSATLPAHRRDRLTSAYQAGLIGESGAQLGTPAGYPRLTIVDRLGSETITVDDDRPGRTVHLDHDVSVDEVDGVVETVTAQIADGGCVAVVCSTVDLAQQRYQALRARHPHLDLLLLHSRIRPRERAPIEQQLSSLLGPLAMGEARPHCLVVVATQVIEQSLDIDFDVMLSDLAPIDLLIQRAGRVHRHACRSRPERHRRPRLIVLDTSGGDAIDRPLPQGAGAVYVDAVLRRTRATLRGRDAIDEPADLDDVIGSVYSDDLPSSLRAGEGESISVADESAREEERQHRAWANDNGIGDPNREDAPWRQRRGSIEDGDVPGAGPRFAAVTRWSERPTIDVVVLTSGEADLAERTLDADTARELLTRSVGISAPRVVGRILEEPNSHRPSRWASHGALRHHALLVAGANEFGVDWDPVLGVTL